MREEGLCGDWSQPCAWFCNTWRRMDCYVNEPSCVGGVTTVCGTTRQNVVSCFVWLCRTSGASGGVPRADPGKGGEGGRFMCVTVISMVLLVYEGRFFLCVTGWSVLLLLLYWCMKSCDFVCVAVWSVFLRLLLLYWSMTACNFCVLCCEVSIYYSTTSPLLFYWCMKARHV